MGSQLNNQLWVNSLKVAESLFLGPLHLFHTTQTTFFLQISSVTFECSYQVLNFFDVSFFFTFNPASISSFLFPFSTHFIFFHRLSLFSYQLCFLLKPTTTTFPLR